MPTLTRTDGVEIHYEARGEGPHVVICSHFFAYPKVWENLIAELAGDHRVIAYDARGTGRSSRSGPYDVATDAADLAAVIGQEGGPAVPICFGDAAFRGIRLALDSPELVPALVVTGGNPLLPADEYPEASEALTGSDSVTAAILQMMESDYRGALRTLVASTSPQMGEQEIRERVRMSAEYATQEAAIARLDMYVNDYPEQDRARQLGNRLWFLHFPTPWSPEDTVAATRRFLPGAHVEAIEDGPISRPDLVAGTVRRLTATVRQGQG